MAFEYKYKCLIYTNKLRDLYTICEIGEMLVR